MTPERWRQVTGVFHAALAREASARAQYLDEACTNDAALRAEVEAMLSAHIERASPSVALKRPPQLESGTMISVYRIDRLIGTGGMGEVYRARDTKLGRDVAVKVLPAPFTADAERLARFEREARLLAALNHPHIAAIYGFEEADGFRALILELVEGDTLADRVAHGPIPIDEALAIARQVAEALEAAHEKGIIHRDLKPANITITPADVVKVLDFGLAKIYAGEGAGPDLLQAPTITAGTREGMILGTAAYMSPEQARGQVVDKRTDIWAFGCVLYEILTGRPVFLQETVSDTIAGILEREPDFSGLPDKTPAAIRRLLRRSLEKDRKRRLPDIGVALIEIDEAITSPVTEQSLTAQSARGRERIMWALGAMAVLTIGAVAISATLYLRRALPEPVVTRLDVVTPPSSEAYSFPLSPDGRQIAFVANGEKGSQLWVRPLDQVKAQPLAGTEGASEPFWSPDGHAVGFFADGKLKRINLIGGAPQVLADAPIGRGGTWNRDGVIVFAPRTSGPLMRVMATGGTPVPVTQIAAGQRSHRFPQFLPDGRNLLFEMFNGQPGTNGLYMASLDGGEPKRLLAEGFAAYSPPGYLLLVRQGVLLAQRFDVARATLAGEPIPVAQEVASFSTSAVGVLAHRAVAASQRQLLWVDRTGKMLGAIGPPDENVLSNLALAPDDQRVAVNRSVQDNLDVWLMDLGRAVPSRLTFDANTDMRPVWSPDGSQVVFTSTRTGEGHLFAKSASGVADETSLLVSVQDKAALDWSLDGRVLLYSAQDPKTASDLWALPMTGERKPFPVAQTSFDEIEGQFSPDARWLAYVSNESGRYEIYLTPFPEAGGKWLVSTAGGAQPRWRRDGRELFYVAADGLLMAVPVRMATDSRAVNVGAPVALFQTRLASGASIAVAGALARAQYAVAADGRFLMIVAGDEAVTSPITIIQNWTAALKK